MRQTVLLAATALFLGSCTKEKKPEPVVQIVRAGVVEEIQPDVPERFSVSIEPFAQVDLAFKSGGIVEQILQVRGADGRTRDVQAGDTIGRNAKLAQVRPLDYKYRLDQAEAQRAQAAAELTKGQAQLAQARANLSESEIEYKRASNLFQSASLVKPEYDQARGRYDSDAESVAAATDAVKAAEDNLANARAAVNEANLSQRRGVTRPVFRLDFGAKRRSRKSGGQFDGWLQHAGYPSGQGGFCGARHHALDDPPGAEAAREAGCFSAHRNWSDHFDFPAGRSAEPRVQYRSDNTKLAGGYQARHDRIGDFKRCARFETPPRSTAQRGGARAPRPEWVRGFPLNRARRENVRFGADHRHRPDLRKFDRGDART